MVRRVAVAAVAVVSVMVMAAPASASTGWVIQPVPSGPGTKNGLAAVACSAATDCTAAGFTVSSSGTAVTLAEHWDSTSWTIQPTPNPSGATDSYLSSVSCPSATACTAVGYSVSSSGVSSPLAEFWNGSLWALQTVPGAPGASSSQLTGVSCLSAAQCTAVGSAVSSGVVVTLAEQWNGTAWAVQSTANPSGTLGNDLQSVSCPRATACIAVGYSLNASAAQVPLAERWKGTNWVVQSMPSPAGASLVDVSAVSCRSASACTAVGIYLNSSSNTLPLAERWNGTSWAIQAPVNPSPGTAAAFQAVWCPTTSTCTAVGEYANASSVQVTLAEHWNGTSWAVQHTPNPTGAKYALLTAVSCTASATCSAAGQWETSSGAQLPLAEHR